MGPVIYAVEFASGRRYIGATQNFSGRRSHHLYRMKLGRAVNKAVQAEYAAHGLPSFTLLASCLSIGSLLDLEAQIIEQSNPELNMPRPDRILVVQGTSYPVTHAAKVFGVTAAQIHSRLSMGWSDAQAVGVEPNPQKLKGDATRKAKQERAAKHMVEFEGETARLSDLCKRFGIPYAKAKCRIKSGWSFAEVRDWWRGGHAYW